MASNIYEGLFILDSNRYASDAAGSVAQINQAIESCEGEILASRLWEERRLAYPIGQHRKGTYWLTYFRLESTRVPEVERNAQLSDAIIRSLVTKIDPQIAATLVQHALSGGKREEAETPAKSF